MYPTVPTGLQTDKRQRQDIEGLRALGALLVAGFHIWEQGVSGGVDVFFVVSGYFLGLGYKGLRDSGKSLQATDHFGRFIRRTVPEATLVLLAILVLGVVFISPAQWQSLLRNVVFSALYLENFDLIRLGQDYLSRDLDVSLTQHFWAVALIAQAYALWYLVAHLSSAIARGLRSDPKNALTVVLCVLGALSMAYSLIRTQSDPAAAYFDLLTRYWQFCVGTLLGLWLVNERIPQVLATLLSWLGLALILSCGIVIGSSASFPGYAALWPVMAAGLILAAGRGNQRTNAGYWLAKWPLANLGTYSFGIYLWHWPIYIAVLNATEQTPSAILGLTIIFFAIVLAYMSHKLTALWLIPRTSKRWGPMVTTGFCMFGLFSVAAASTGIYTVIEHYGSRLDSALFSVSPGALSAHNDNPVSYTSGCHQNQYSSEAKRCIFGPPDASKTLFLVGGSHSAHWLPGLQIAALPKGWKIVSITKSSCLFTAPVDEPPASGRQSSCSEWNQTVIDEILLERPDLVVTLATRPAYRGRGGDGLPVITTERIPEGYIDNFTKMTEAGIRVVALRDNPWMGQDIPSCVFSGFLHAERPPCARRRADVLNDAELMNSLARLPGKVVYVDMTDTLCDADLCDVVRDGTLIYRDAHHLTATYSEYLGPLLMERIEAGLAAGNE